MKGQAADWKMNRASDQETFNVTLDTFRDESLQSTNCTGTDNPGDEDSAATYRGKTPVRR